MRVLIITFSIMVAIISIGDFFVDLDLGWSSFVLCFVLILFLLVCYIGKISKDGLE